MLMIPRMRRIIDLSNLATCHFCTAKARFGILVDTQIIANINMITNKTNVTERTFIFRLLF